MQSARLDGRVVTCHQPNRRLGRISGREAELIEAGSWPVPRLAIASHFRRLGVSFSQPRVGSAASSELCTAGGRRVLVLAGSARSAPRCRSGDFWQQSLQQAGRAAGQGRLEALSRGRKADGDHLRASAPPCSPQIRAGGWRCLP